MLELRRTDAALKNLPQFSVDHAVDNPALLPAKPHQHWFCGWCLVFQHKYAAEMH
jgi:hypothetical protein